MSACFCEEFGPCHCADRLGPLTWRAALFGLLHDEMILAAGADALVRFLGLANASDADRLHVRAAHAAAVELWPLRKMHLAVDRVIARQGAEPTADALFHELAHEYGTRPTRERWRHAAGALASAMQARGDGTFAPMTRHERSAWEASLAQIRRWEMPNQQHVAVAAE